MDGLLGVSIIIPNYNYASFIGQAIESALAQDHANVEVIVVDDCSTDGSRAVIERYGERVRAVFLPENGGQVAAINAAWPLARYEILIFLDSDDALMPCTASTIARAWAPGVSKIQFPMVSIDAQGRDLGHVAPKYLMHLDTQTIRRELLNTGTCPTTQGSGNAYAKWLLEKLAPVEGLMWMDTILEVNAPFYGDIITLTQPLAYYRMHENNWSQQSDVDPDRFVRYLRLYDEKAVYFQKRAKEWGFEFDTEAAKRRSIWYLEYQMATSRLLPAITWQGESPVRVLGYAARAAVRSPGGLKRKTILLAWFFSMAFAPAPVAKRLAAMRFVIAKRPRWLEAAIGVKRETAAKERGTADRAQAKVLDRTPRQSDGTQLEPRLTPASSANER